MNKSYDIFSAKSIILYAKKLKNQTLRQACGEEIVKANFKGKGGFGQLLEKFYFGYEPNSNPNADFQEVGLELKASPLKTLKNGEIRSKERLVLNIINYLEVHKEEFENSSFCKKNAHLLLVFYLHERDKHLLDYLIKIVGDWKYPEEDLEIIKQDWEKINQKIKAGQAHELSESDTFYLGACTKGSTAAKSFREQPFNSKQAKQRAYSLKQGYVNHIIANIAKDEKPVYGKIIKSPKELQKKQTLEDIVIGKFTPFFNKKPKEIEELFDLDLNSKSKNYYASITNKILGLELEQKIEEFEKAEIKVKTIRVKENNLPKEDISFPTFKFKELVETEWEESDFKKIFESKFFFVFYQFKGDNLVLRKVKFWNMSNSDLEEAKEVWDSTVDLIKNGNIVSTVTNKGIRKTNFPKKTENRISHVRPHAKNANDTYPLPVKDQVTNQIEYTKHCFWLNASYVRDEIFLK